jgi:hypothetical protein
MSGHERHRRPPQDQIGALLGDHARGSVGGAADVTGVIEASMTRSQPRLWDACGSGSVA